MSWDPKFAYYFTIESPLVTNVDSKVEVPGGVRCKYEYLTDQMGAAKVTSDADKYLASWGDQLIPLVDECLRKPAAFPTIVKVVGSAKPDAGARAIAQLVGKAGVDDKITAAVCDALRAELAGFRLWPGLAGEVSSGWDWVMLREDGVALFDARVTMMLTVANPVAGKPSLRVPVDGTYRGVVDLGLAALGQFRNPSGAGGPPQPVSVHLAVRFEAPSGALIADWVKATSYGTQVEVFQKVYERLVRRQFIGVGNVWLDKSTRYWPATRIAVDVHELFS